MMQLKETLDLWEAIKLHLCHVSSVCNLYVAHHVHISVEAKCESLKLTHTLLLVVQLSLIKQTEYLCVSVQGFFTDGFPCL